MPTPSKGGYLYFPTCEFPYRLIISRCRNPDLGCSETRRTVNVNYLCYYIRWYTSLSSRPANLHSGDYQPKRFYPLREGCSDSLHPYLTSGLLRGGTSKNTRYLTLLLVRGGVPWDGVYFKMQYTYTILTNFSFYWLSTSYDKNGNSSFYKTLWFK